MLVTSPYDANWNSNNFSEKFPIYEDESFDCDGDQTPPQEVQVEEGDQIENEKSDHEIHKVKKVPSKNAEATFDTNENGSELNLKPSFPQPLVAKMVTQSF